MKEIHFKSPRDPNAPYDLGVLKYYTSFDKISCQVGSGECNNLACCGVDNGEGGIYNLCLPHVKEFEALEKLIKEMTPNQISNFENAIIAAG